MNKVSFSTDLCKGCGLCTEVCPKKILILSPDKLNVKGYHPAMIIDMEKCIACAMCATMCPDSVIRVERDV